MLVSCFRAASVKTLAAGAGRRLANEPPQGEDQAELSVPLGECIDLQETIGSNFLLETPAALSQPSPGDFLNSAVSF